MILRRLVALIVLTLWYVSLSAQFTVEELQEIRVDQIKSIACDTLLSNREEKIYLLQMKSAAMNEAIYKYQLKDSLCASEAQYYREQLRDRDREIRRLQRVSKLQKIIFLGVLLTTGATFGVFIGL